MNGWIFILVCLAILTWVAFCLVYDKRPRFLREITAITVLCIWISALWTLIRRFSEGLGAVTGMNDAANKHRTLALSAQLNLYGKATCGVLPYVASP